MRHFALLALLLLGCGKSNAHKDAAVFGQEFVMASGSDAAVPTCAFAPVSGTNVTLRQLPVNLGGVLTLVTSPPNDNRLFALEQDGPIRLIENEQLVTTPFLDMSLAPAFEAGGELGLLGMAFHPKYATNGTFYVFYTVGTAANSPTPYMDVLARYQVSATNPEVADPTSATILLAIPDPFSNHNGGMIEFGADGYLYIGTGDGGSAGDPNRNGQNPNALLAKILRIDVDHPSGSKPYGIPADNPYASGVSGAPEVFLIGVRNPWRWSFDRATGDMWIGDVGQNETEELDVLKAGQQAGKNLGWSMYEGSGCCATQDDTCSQVAPFQTCNPAGITMPQDQRAHSTGWNAIIGGQVYRGACYPDLVGTYFYTDNGHGGLSEAKLQGDGSLAITDLTGTFPGGPSSLHAIWNGEIYETDISGNVYHLEVMP
jgi:glucose/arabinose dehydrogenase